jgi:hypothetical protein
MDIKRSPEGCRCLEDWQKVRVIKVAFAGPTEEHSSIEAKLYESASQFRRRFLG